MDLERRLHIAILAYCLEGGGIQRQTLTLARELVSRGHAVDYLVVRGEGELYAQVPPSVAVVDLLPANGHVRWKALDQVRAFARLVKYLKTRKPDALLAGGTHINLLAVLAHAASRSTARLVLRLTNHVSQSHTSPGPLRRLSIAVAARIYPRADAIIAVSEEVRRDFLRATSIAPALTHMIREPVITTAVPALAAEEVGHPWLQAGAPPVILSVGRLSPQKDFETLVRAFALVRRQREVRLIVIGAGTELPYARKLRKLAATLSVADAVDFPGYALNPYAYIARPKVFALSSAWEGCPNVVIEALYLGCAVVATDCPGGVREVIEAAGVGRLVPMKDPDAMAAALLAALNGEVPTCPRGTCLSGFDAATSTDQYLAVLAGG